VAFGRREGLAAGPPLVGSGGKVVGIEVGTKSGVVLLPSRAISGTVIAIASNARNNTAPIKRSARQHGIFVSVSPSPPDRRRRRPSFFLLDRDWRLEGPARNESPAGCFLRSFLEFGSGSAMVAFVIHQRALLDPVFLGWGVLWS